MQFFLFCLLRQLADSADTLPELVENFWFIP